MKNASASLGHAIRITLAAASVFHGAATWAVGEPNVIKRAPVAAAKPGIPTKLNANARLAAPAKTSATADGFTIERVPAWVRPLAAEPPAGLAAAPLQILLIDRQRRLERSGTVSYAHAVRQINDSTGLQNGAQIEIEFDPTYEKLALHQLAIVRGDKRIDKLDRKIVKLLHRETQLERQMVDGRMTASIVVDDLRVGDRLEWAFSRTGDNPVFEGRYVDTEWTQSEGGPTGLFQLRLSYPAERTLQHRVNDPAITVENSTEGAWKELLFRGRNLPQFHYDPLLPTTEYLKHEIDVSEFTDWAEVGAWAERLFARAIKPSPAIEARIAEIKAGAATPDAQLLAALDFVQQDVRYFGTEIGADSHQPASADTVLAQRFGDCKDKVALFATLAKGLGFEATPILVSTRYGTETRSRLPSPLMFDHAIAGIKVDGKTVWLDGTRSQQTGSVAARESVGLGTGLLASALAAPLQDLPTGLDATRSEVVDTFHFPSLAKEGTLETVSTYYGDIAEVMRQAKSGTAEAEFNKALASDMLRGYPSLVLESVSALEPVPDKNAVKITLRYRTGKFWGFPEQRALRSEVALMTLFPPLRLPDSTPRTEPLATWPKGRYLHTVKVLIDEPVVIKPVENQFDETNAQYELHVKASTGPHEQVLEGELTHLTDRIEPADWASYRDRLSKVFPRMGMVVIVPLLTQVEVDAMRLEAEAFDSRVRKGDLRIFTRDQIVSRSRLILLNAELNSGRIPENLRSEVLVELAIQLDRLGREGEAQGVLEKALALDADSAEVHSALATNALLRRADAQAVEQATLALKLVPSDNAARYVRAWARYFAGDFAATRSELQELLKSRAEIDRSYGALWLYLATRRMGDDGAAAIQPLQASGSKPAWPYAVVQWFSGKSDFDSDLAATRIDGKPDPGRECEFYFFAGERALLDGDVNKARAYLQRSLATGVREYTEYQLAQRELDRTPRP